MGGFLWRRVRATADLHQSRKGPGRQLRRSAPAVDASSKTIFTGRRCTIFCKVARRVIGRGAMQTSRPVPRRKKKLSSVPVKNACPSIASTSMSTIVADAQFLELALLEVRDDPKRDSLTTDING